MNPDGSIRVAHFSDLHYGPKNLTEAERCFGGLAHVDQRYARADRACAPFFRADDLSGG